MEGNKMQEMSTKDILNTFGYVSPKSPTTAYTAIIKTDFAENCCNIWDDMHTCEDDVKWVSVRRCINMQIGNEKDYFAREYVEYVLSQFSSTDEKKDIHFPEDMTREELDDLIFNNLLKFEWMFMSICKSKVDITHHVIPVNFNIYEFSKNNGDDLSSRLDFNDDYQRNDLIRVVHENYNAIVYNALNAVKTFGDTHIEYSDIADKKYHIIANRIEYKTSL